MKAKWSRNRQRRRLVYELKFDGIRAIAVKNDKRF